MTTVDAFFTKAASDEKLVRNGRYHIPKPDGSPGSYQRVSTFVRILRDTYLLDRRNRRMVALGLARRPDLLARVAACTPDQRNELNDLCDEADEAAEASSGRNLGTAMHAFTEQLDRGEPVYAPEPLNLDLDAYRSALTLHGIDMSVALMEQIVVLEELGVAGRFDRIVSMPGFEQPMIADLKTGGYLEVNEISVQLACYANADCIYDPVVGQRVAMPDVDKERALVIHLPIGKATCELIVIDIAAGWEAAQHAAWVRGWRKRPVVVQRFASQPAASTPSSVEANGGTTVGPVAAAPVSPRVGTVPVTRDSIAARVRALEHLPGAVGHLGRLLKTAGLPRLGVLDDGRLGDYAACVSAVEREHNAPLMPAELQPFAVEPDPFAGLPSSDGGHHVTVSSVPATDERPGGVEAHPPVLPSPGLLARYNALPADLRVAVDAARTGTVLEGCNIRSGGTAEQVEKAAELIVAAELDHEKRKAFIASLLQGLDDDMVEVLRCAASDVDLDLAVAS